MTAMLGKYHSSNVPKRKTNCIQRSEALLTTQILFEQTACTIFELEIEFHFLLGQLLVPMMVERLRRVELAPM
jgi:hypothetical protein